MTPTGRKAVAIRRRALVALADALVCVGLWPACCALAGGPARIDVLVALALVPAVCLARSWSRAGDALSHVRWSARIVPALGMVAVTGGFLAILVAVADAARLPIAAAWAGAAALWVLASRWAMPAAAGGSRLRVLLIGHPASIARVADHLAAEPGERIAIGDCPWQPGRPTDAQLDAIDARVVDADPDEVLLCTDLADRGTLLAVLQRLRPRAVPLLLVPEFGELPLFCLRSAEVSGLPALCLSDSPLEEGALTMKWIEDKVLGGLLLLLVSPVMLAVAIAVRLSGPGPVLFVQERHGLGGRVIRVYKFRTMHHGMGPAPGDSSTGGSSIARPSIGSRATSDFQQATAGDPRITSLGRFLRNTSLDELPQFINVVQGRMSLVGPRPHPLRLNHQYVPDIADLMRRHYVKPGITGLAQISGARGETRSVEAMRRRVELDLEYIRTWSLWLDLRIIALTVVKGFINHQP